MYRRYAYNEDMKTLVYVHSNGTLSKDNEPSACLHEVEEAVEFTTSYVTYDGVETCVTKGRACVECGLLLAGDSHDDNSTEDNLMELLGNV